MIWWWNRGWVLEAKFPCHRSRVSKLHQYVHPRSHRWKLEIQITNGRGTTRDQPITYSNRQEASHIRHPGRNGKAPESIRCLIRTVRYSDVLTKPRKFRGDESVKQSSFCLGVFALFRYSCTRSIFAVVYEIRFPAPDFWSRWSLTNRLHIAGSSSDQRDHVPSGGGAGL